MSFTNSDIEQVKRPKIARNKYNYVNGAITSVGNYYSSRGSSNSGGSGGVYYSNFIGCSDVSDGGNGLVPAPGAGQHRHYLCGNGNWVYSGSYYDSSTLYVDADNTVFLNNVSLGDKASANNFIATNLTSTTANITTAVINNASINTEIVKTSSIENLTVTGSAHFFNLMVDEVKACGGQLLLSAADFVVDKVVMLPIVTAPRIVKVKFADATNIHMIRLCQKSSDTDGNEILNKWSVGDLAYCQTFNLSSGGVYSESENKFYWVLVVAVGTITISGVKYNCIDCCDKYYKNNDPTVGFPVGKGSFNPEVGDNIALLGNIIDTDRQNAIIISAYKSPDANVTAPSIVQYKGINDFSLDGKIYNKMAANGNTFRGDFKVSSGLDISTYIDNLITESVDSAIWKMVQTELSATVSKTDVLTFTAKYGVYKQDGSVMSLQTSSTTDDNKSIVVRYKSDVDNSYTNISIIRNYYECSKTINNYHKQTSKPTKYIVELVIDNTIIQTDTIPVVFNAGAILEITDSISETVSDVSGNLSQVVQSSSTWVSTISDVSNRVSAIEQTAGNLSLYVKESDLKTTGIDISTGTITLNADKTTINGMLGLHDSDDGLVIYDNNDFPRVILDNHTDDSSMLTQTRLYDKRSTGPTYLPKGKQQTWKYNAFNKTGYKTSDYNDGFAFVIESGSFYCLNPNGSAQETTSHRVNATVYVIGDTTKDSWSKTTEIPWVYSNNPYKIMVRNTKIPIPKYKGNDSTFTISVDIIHEWLCVSEDTKIFCRVLLSAPVKYCTHIGDDTIYALHGACDGFFTDGKKTIINGGFASKGIMVDDNGLHRPIGRFIENSSTNGNYYKLHYGSPTQRNINEVNYNFSNTDQTAYYYKQQRGTKETLGTGKIWNWCSDTNTYDTDYIVLDDVDTITNTSGNKYILMPDTATSAATMSVSLRVNFSTGREIKMFVRGSTSNLRVCTYDNTFGFNRLWDNGWTTYIQLQTGYMYTFTLGTYGWYVERHG